MTAHDDPELRSVAAEALTVGDVVSAVIFVLRPGGTRLQVAAAAGVGGPALDRLAAAVREPGHPVARALSEPEPSFDVRPTAPGGPDLRSHLALRTGAGHAATGVLALAHDAPVAESDRTRLTHLAARAADAIARSSAGGRRLVVAENSTANGVIEFLDPWFDPGEQEDDELLEVIRGHMALETALILGRQTFEDFRGYWPHQADDATGFTAHLNRVPKYVVSRTMTDPGWQNSTVLSGPLEDGVRALKGHGAGEIGVTGSISVVHALMAADLVDEYRLFVYPALTSRGRNLVPDGLSLHGLALSDARSFPSGVALLTYLRR